MRRGNFQEGMGKGQAKEKKKGGEFLSEFSSFFFWIHMAVI